MTVVLHSPWHVCGTRADHQLGNWLVIRCCPQYLQLRGFCLVHDCPLCTVSDRAIGTQGARPAGDLAIGGYSQAKASGVVAEKYAEPPRAVFSDPATGDDAVQRDRLTVTTLQTEQARTITAGISTRQVACLQPRHLAALRKRQLEESTTAGTAYGSGAAELDWYQGGEYVITDQTGDSRSPRVVFRRVRPPAPAGRAAEDHPARLASHDPDAHGACGRADLDRQQVGGSL